MSYFKRFLFVTTAMIPVFNPLQQRPAVSSTR
jgi:hypothetical protein